MNGMRSSVVVIFTAFSLMSMNNAVAQQSDHPNRMTLSSQRVTSSFLKGCQRLQKNIQCLLPGSRSLTLSRHHKPDRFTPVANGAWEAVRIVWSNAWSKSI